MKKYFKIIALTISVVFVSCDKDFNTVGSDLVGDEHFDYDVDQNAEIKAYTVPTGEVQTNNLTINPLGIYNNDVFGTTSASFVSQLSLSIGKPDFGTNVVVRDVYLYVPFFSKVSVTDSDNNSTYELDSIYSNNFDVQDDLDQLINKKIKLSVYENGYYIQNSDPEGGIQKYYSDMESQIDAHKKGNDGSGNVTSSNPLKLNDDIDVSENDQFYFNKNEIKIYKKKTVNGNYVYVDDSDVPLSAADQLDPTKWKVKERLAPGIYLKLNKDYFYKRIMDVTNPNNLDLVNLFNNNTFRNYFRGLYFKAEAISGVEPAMAILNFSKAKVNINYSSISTGATEVSDKTFVLNFGVTSGNNSISLLNNNFNSNYLNNGILNSQNNPSSPDYGKNERLYLKGGKGSIVYMDLFGPDNDGDGVADQLEVYRNNKWMINDAYIELYIDKTIMDPLKNSEEALRLYLFDATNQKPIVDYTGDVTSNANPKFNKLVYGGLIDRVSTSDGVKYKIRITNLINNILNSTNELYNKNIRLGLSVTESIGVTSNFYFKNPITILGQEIKFFPAASIMSSTGTVIHGPNSSDVDKRLKLTIHYTKPN